MSVRVLNPNAEVLNKSAALHMNINAAKGLQDVLKSNLGPKGTIKMSVSFFRFHSDVVFFLPFNLLSFFFSYFLLGLLVELVILNSQRMVTHY